MRKRKVHTYFLCNSSSWNHGRQFSKKRYYNYIKIFIAYRSNEHTACYILNISINLKKRSTIRLLLSQALFTCIFDACPSFLIFYSFKLFFRWNIVFTRYQLLQLRIKLKQTWFRLCLVGQRIWVFLRNDWKWSRYYFYCNRKLVLNWF